MKEIIVGMKFKYAPSKSTVKMIVTDEFFSKKNLVEDDIITIRTVDNHFIGVSINRSRVVKTVVRDTFERLFKAKMMEVM